MIFTKSKCRGRWLHRFDIIGAFDGGVLERCRICHKKVSFRGIGGNVRNTDYLAYHMRNALPREHRLFGREYPEHAR